MLEGLSYTAQAYHMGRMTDSKRIPRPRDPNQLAKLVADIATGETDDRVLTDDGRDLAAVLLGRRGGLKGGRARAKQSQPKDRWMAVGVQIGRAIQKRPMMELGENQPPAAKNQSVQDLPRFLKSDC